MPFLVTSCNTHATFGILESHYDFFLVLRYIHQYVYHQYMHSKLLMIIIQIYHFPSSCKVYTSGIALQPMCLWKLFILIKLRKERTVINDCDVG